ncbi:MAG: hypothetical protein Q9170_004042 [Blastenia crenularia]
MKNRLSILSPPFELVDNARDVERQNNSSSQLIAPLPTSSLPGIGLGPIDPKFLTREAWPLDTSWQLTQYSKFLRLMIHRIRGSESNDDETEYFIHLLDRPGGWNHLASIRELLPELAEHGPVAMNEEMDRLLDNVRSVLNVQRYDDTSKSLGTQTHRHHPEALRVPTSVVDVSTQPPGMSTAHALPIQPVPTEFHKLPPPTFPPTAGDASPEFSPSPPKSLPREPTGSDTAAAASGSNVPGKDSFWYFDKCSTTEYEKFFQPITEADGAPLYVYAREQTPVSQGVTEEGTIVSKGFKKAPTAERDAMLKASPTIISR